MTIPIIILTGATATGKTALALQLADQYPVHLISVDSVQVYRGMDIGSAKLSRELLRQYPHALIDILEPEHPYSASKFAEDAKKEIQWARNNHKIPVLIGGSMLYFQALFSEMNNLPPSNYEIRQRIIAQLEAGENLHQKLKELDPEIANQVNENDFKRISRFLELIELTGKTPTQLFAEQKRNQPTNILTIGLNIERAELHQRIEKRFLEMITMGFIDEVEALFQRPHLNLQTPAIQSAGYQQIWRYLLGEYDQKTAIEQGIIATRQLAKRQITWLNNGLKKLFTQDFYIIEPNQNHFFELIKKHLNDFEKIK